MKIIFSDAQLIMVVNAQNVLQEIGIESQIKNEFLSGGAGDLSPLDSWPELWVSVADADRAAVVIKQMTSEVAEDWLCIPCGEKNGGAFEQCWQCSEERPND